MISVPGKPIQKLHIQVHTKNAPFLSWLIVQYVTRKSAEVFVREALKVPLDQDLLQISVKTGTCRGCSFDPVKALDRLVFEGSAQCPQCGAPIVLSDLRETEKKQEPLEAMPSMVCSVESDEEEEAASVVEEDPEVKKVRPLLYDHIASLLKPSGKPLFGELLFDGKGIEFNEDAPFELGSTKDYLRDLDDFI